MNNGKVKTRDHILSVARREFAERGYYAASMDSIVQASGLSKGAIYWHFKSKLALFDAVLHMEVFNIREIMFPTREDLWLKDIHQFFLERGERLIDFYISRREVALLWLHVNLEAQRGNTEVADLARNLLDSLIDELIQRITDLHPDLSRLKDGLDLKELIILFEANFNGLLLDLKFKDDPELTKKLWRFLVNNLLSEKVIK